eukprot:1701769-Pleurochrysis_carterae.AAC.1
MACGPSFWRILGLQMPACSRLMVRFWMVAMGYSQQATSRKRKSNQSGRGIPAWVRVLGSFSSKANHEVTDFGGSRGWYRELVDRVVRDHRDQEVVSRFMADFGHESGCKLLLGNGEPQRRVTFFQEASGHKGLRGTRGSCKVRWHSRQL